MENMEVMNLFSRQREQKWVTIEHSNSKYSSAQLFENVSYIYFYNLVITFTTALNVYGLVLKLHGHGGVCEVMLYTAPQSFTTDGVAIFG